jgi:cohesin loading factor subunit SCC2
LAAALKQANVWIQDPEEEEFGSKSDRDKVLSFGVKVKNALRDVWTDHTTDVFDIGFAPAGFSLGMPLIFLAIVHKTT